MANRGTRRFGLLLGLLAGAILQQSAAAAPLDIQPRIANGVAASGWPEVASVTSDAGFCSAVFVGCRSVLTAAHCVCATNGTGDACDDTGFLLDPEQVAIVFTPQGGAFEVESITIPADYEFGESGDIAVLKLKKPLRGIRPREINTHAYPPHATSGVIVGFGATEGAARDMGIKRMGAMTTVDCAGLEIDDWTHVCWRFDKPLGPAGTDSNTCSGDSGGPLFADVGSGTTLIGIHSGGFGECSEGTDEGGPIIGAFDTSVYHVHSWIEAQLGVDLDSAACGDGPQVGDASVTTWDWNGTVSTQVLRSFSVPAGTKLLRVGLVGEFGTDNDFDLYLKHGSTPTTGTGTNADCASTVDWSQEYCEIPDPEPGIWYAFIDAKSGAGQYQLTATALPENPAPPALTSGDLLVSSFRGSEILQVDPQDGDRWVHSSDLRGAGFGLYFPEGMALDRDGSVVVANPFGGNLIRLDPDTGDREVISGCADETCSSQVGSGPELMIPRFVALESNGDILVADRLVPGTWAVVRVNPGNGNRTLLSGCADETCADFRGEGPAVDRLFGIAVEGNGDILIADSKAVLRIDPDTGDREILSGCADAACSRYEGAGPEFGEPGDLVIDEAGDVYVTYQIEGSAFGAIRKVDPQTGQRTLVSGCSDVDCSTQRGSGPGFIGILGITFDTHGDFVVGDFVQDAVFHVDFGSGNRTLLSGCMGEACPNERGEGTRFAEALDVVVIPEPDVHSSQMVVMALLGVLGAARRHSIPKRI